LRTISPQVADSIHCVEATKTTLIRNVLRLIAEIRQIDRDAAITRPGTGYSFEHYREEIVCVLDLLPRLTQARLESIDEVTLKGLVDGIGHVHTALLGMLGFSGRPANSNDTYQLLVREYRDGARDALPLIRAMALQTILEEADVSGVSETYRRDADEIARMKESYTADKVAASDWLREVQRVRGQALDVIAQVRASLVARTITTHEAYFDGAADAHKTAAKTWLRWALVFTTATICIGLWFGLGSVPSEHAQLIQWAIFRGLLLFVSLYAAFWCIRQYRTSKHLEVVNRHRQNALHTYTTFAESSQDDSAKNALLLEAARCIFTPMPSGYLEGGDDNPTSRFVEVLNVIRGGGNTSKSP